MIRLDFARALNARASARMIAPAVGVLLATTMLAGVPGAHAQTVVNGGGGTGMVVTPNSALANTNSGVVGSNYSAGTAGQQTVYTNYSTVGGLGSGGGGGLGGVFFVDSGASLTLQNVSFIGNTATGGQGGGVKVESVAQSAFSVAGSSADATAFAEFNPTAALTYSNGAVAITSFTVAQPNSLYGVGSGVGVVTKGQQTVAGSTVSSTTLNNDGTETVNLANSLSLSVGHGLNPVVTTNVFGTASFSLTDASNSGVLQGMQVVVVGANNSYTVGTVDTVSYDSNGNVSSFTAKDANGNPISLLNPALFGNTQIYVVDAHQYAFSRVADSVNGSSTSNTLVSTGAVAGFAPGMTVTGTGVPSGTTVTNVTSQVDPNTGNTITTITLSNAVDLTKAFDLKAVANPLVSNTGQAVLQLASVAGLVAGETISGIGIPVGTKIVSVVGNTVTLSNALGAAAVNSIKNSSLLVTVDPVTGPVVLNTVPLASVAGLTIGAEITGAGIPANAQITHIDTVTKTVTFVVNPALANVNSGGSMNGLVAPGTPGSNGLNGQAGTTYAATYDNGEGSPGTNGQTGGAGNNAAGGNGGTGGPGSNGSSTNKTLTVATVLDAVGLIGDIAGLAGDADPFTFTKAAGDLIHLAADATRTVFDIVQLAEWQTAEGQGLVALGGAGGQAGNGGAGSDFFGGGAGGAGGKGGQGAETITLGGSGGLGGNGGAGGFGAGGGDSGAGGQGGSTGYQANNTPGSPGAAGFGGGVGSVAGQNGGGGSGFGGAIFVRSGGTLNITGNAVFQNNVALAGSSSNGGQAGQSAGADLFMMKGSSVNLAPGTGNTITFYDGIADDSLASIGASSIAAGSGASLRIMGGGTVQFFGTNTYSGVTEISGATLEAQDGSGINVYSQILFDGTGAIGASLSTTTAGALLSGGTFARRVGGIANAQAPANVTWTGSGGFAATSSNLTLAFGTANGGALQSLAWNQSGFVPTGSTLVFGSDAVDATGIVTLTNNVALNNLNGQIAVYRNSGNTATYDAVLAGRWTGGTLTVGDTGYTGTLLMPGQNSLNGVTLNAGALSTVMGAQSGTLMNSTTGGFVTVNGGALTLGGPEKLTTVQVAASGSVTALGAITAGDITNAGAMGFFSTLNANSIDNSGLMLLKGATTVTNGVTNEVGGQLQQQTSLSAANVVNAGLWIIGGDVTTSGTVTNNNQIIVVGDGPALTETAATRTINTVAFTGSPSGVVALGGWSGNVANTLVINQSGNSLYAGTFVAGGGLTKTGAGTLNLTGANTFTGPLTINGGTINTTGGGTFADSVDVTVGASGAYVVGAADTIHSLSNSGSTTANAPFTVSGQVTNTGSGTMTLNAGSTPRFGALTNSGTITANDLLIVSGPYIQNAGSLTSSVGMSTGTFSGAGGTVHLNNISTFVAIQSANGTFAGVIDGNGNLLEEGAATLTLTGTNTYTGLTGISSGATLALSGTGSIADSAQVFDNGTFDISATTNGASIRSLAGSGTTVLGAETLTLTNAFTLFSGVIQGSGGLTVAGGAEGLTGTNSYTGVTNINAGAGLFLDNSGSISNSSNVVDNGLFDISATTSGASIITLSGSGVTNLGAQTLTLTNASTTFSGGIQGSGGLTVGAGTETLSGTNSFTGQTNIAAGADIKLTGTGSIAQSSNVVDQGILDISGTTAGAGIVTLSGAGGVALGAQTLSITNGSTTFSGAISGTGGLTASGGAETLTGANSFTGATSISAGATINLSGAGTLASSSGVADNGTFDISGSTGDQSITTLSGSGVVTLGARTLSLTNASTTFSGSAQGTGGLTVAAGTETLSGTNTYTGATTVNSGATLSLSGLGSIAASSNVIDNGVFDISGTTSGASIVTLSGAGSTVLGSNLLTITNGSTTFSGVISGLGGLTIAGGTETLTGVNTLTGLVTVASGARLNLTGSGSVAASGDPLVLGTFDISGTSGGTSVVSLAGNGTVILGAQTLTLTNASEVFAGVIQNPGGVGAGTGGGLTVAGGAEGLSGVNTYTGATTINSGAALFLFGSGSVAASSGVVDNGTFDISNTTSGATINTLTGTGGVNLGAESLTIVNGASQFGGNIVGTGALNVLSGNFLLNGNSSLGAVNVGGGVFQLGDPTHSPTLTTTGVNVTAGGTLAGYGTINGPVTNTSGVVQPGGAVVGGIGTLTVGSYTQGANGTLLIQVTPTAASQLRVIGAANLAGNLSLAYGAGDYAPHIYRIVQGGTVSGTFSTVSRSGFPADHVMGVSYTGSEVDLTVEPYSAAQGFGAVTTASLDQAQSFAGMISDRLSSAGCAGDLHARSDKDGGACEGSAVWGQVIGRTAHTSSSSLGSAAQDGDGGILFGVDHAFAEGRNFGASIGWTQNSLHQSAAGVSAKGDSVFASLYGGVVTGPVRIGLQGFYMDNSWSLNRTLAGYGVANSHPGGTTGGAVAQLSYPSLSNGVEPYVRVSYADFHRKAIVETGAGVNTLALAVKSQSTASTEAEVGLMLSPQTWEMQGDMRLSPVLRIGIAQDLSSSNRDIRASLAQISGTDFVGHSVRPDQTSAVLAGAIKLNRNDQFDLSADLRGRVSGNQTEGAISLRAAWKF